jgi:SAM-dependent methyltransferase
MHYRPKIYWEERLRQSFSLKNTGHIGFTLLYNNWSYKAKVGVLQKVLSNLKINCEGKSVLDIGCGTGFWIEFYKSQGATSLVGVDITNISIEKLREKFPELEFYELDIGEDEINLNGRFDIINVFDVLYHIRDNLKFEKAISNIAKLSKQGSYIFITDSLIDKSEAEYVTFRSLATYKEQFERNRLRFIEVAPLFYLLNRPYPCFLQIIKFGLIKTKFNIDDIMAPILYYLDKVFLSLERSNLKLIVCVKE